MTLDDFFEQNSDFRPIADLVVIPPPIGEIREKWPDADQELLARCEEPVSFSGLVITRGTLYWKCRLTGSGDRFATMLALGQPPGCQTTDTFWAGRKSWREIYAPGYVKDVERRLQAQGVDIRDKEYMPELARYRGDTEAVMPFDNVRGHIKSLCQKRGWACEGAVNTAHREPESDPHAPQNCIALSERIIRNTGKEMIRDNPDLKRQCATHAGRMKLRKEIIAKHGKPGGKVPQLK